MGDGKDCLPGMRAVEASMPGKSTLTADAAEQADIARPVEIGAARRSGPGAGDPRPAPGQAVLTLEGRKAAAIAAVLGVHVSTVRNWRGYFAHGGVAGLRRRPRPGQQAKIGPHAGAIAAAILDEDVRHDGGWTLVTAVGRDRPARRAGDLAAVAVAPIAPKGFALPAAAPHAQRAPGRSGGRGQPPTAPRSENPGCSGGD